MNFGCPYNFVILQSPPNGRLISQPPAELDCDFYRESKLPNFECDFEAHLSKNLVGFFLTPFQAFQDSSFAVSLLLNCITKIRIILDLSKYISRYFAIIFKIFR